MRDERDGNNGSKPVYITSQRQRRIEEEQIRRWEETKKDPRTTHDLFEMLRRRFSKPL